MNATTVRDRVLSFDFTTLDVAGEALPDVHLITYVPADAETHRKMEVLYRELNDSSPTCSRGSHP